MQLRRPEPLDRAGLVHWFARRYRGRSGALDSKDLVGCTWIGVLEACRRCDPERAAGFPSYLAAWIRKEILEAIRHRSALIHIPDHLQRAGRRPPRRDAGSPVAEIAGNALKSTVRPIVIAVRINRMRQPSGVDSLHLGNPRYRSLSHERARDDDART